MSRDAGTLPAGRLREPLDAAARGATRSIALDDTNRAGLAAIGPAVLLARAAAARRGERRPNRTSRRARPPMDRSWLSPGSPVRRVSLPDLRAAGWTIARELPYPRSSPATRAPDLRRIVDAARATGAAAVLTTEKDLVRLLPFRPFPLPVAYVPMTLEVEPPGTFDAWLRTSVAKARAGRRERGGGRRSAPARIRRRDDRPRAGPAAADDRRARRGHAARPRLPLPSIARTAGWRCSNLEAAFPARPTRSAPRSRATCSRTSAGC